MEKPKRSASKSKNNNMTEKELLDYKKAQDKLLIRLKEQFRLETEYPYSIVESKAERLLRTYMKPSRNSRFDPKDFAPIIPFMSIPKQTRKPSIPITKQKAKSINVIPQSKAANNLSRRLSYPTRGWKDISLPIGLSGRSLSTEVNVPNSSCSSVSTVDSLPSEASSEFYDQYSVNKYWKDGMYEKQSQPTFFLDTNNNQKILEKEKVKVNPKMLRPWKPTINECVLKSRPRSPLRITHPGKPDCSAFTSTASRDNFFASLSSCPKIIPENLDVSEIFHPLHLTSPPILVQNLNESETIVIQENQEVFVEFAIEENQDTSEKTLIQRNSDISEKFVIQESPDISEKNQDVYEKVVIEENVSEKIVIQENVSEIFVVSKNQDVSEKFPIQENISEKFEIQESPDISEKLGNQNISEKIVVLENPDVSEKPENKIEDTYVISQRGYDTEIPSKPNPSQEEVKSTVFVGVMNGDKKAIDNEKCVNAHTEITKDETTVLPAEEIMMCTSAIDFALALIPLPWHTTITDLDNNVVKSSTSVTTLEMEPDFKIKTNEINIEDKLVEKGVPKVGSTSSIIRLFPDAENQPSITISNNFLFVENLTPKQSQLMVEIDNILSRKTSNSLVNNISNKTNIELGAQNEIDKKKRKTNLLPSEEKQILSKLSGIFRKFDYTNSKNITNPKLKKKTKLKSTISAETKAPLWPEWKFDVSLVPKAEHVLAEAKELTNTPAKGEQSALPSNNLYSRKEISRKHSSESKLWDKSEASPLPRWFRKVPQANGTHIPFVRRKDDLLPCNQKLKPNRKPVENELKVQSPKRSAAKCLIVSDSLNIFKTRGNNWSNDSKAELKQTFTKQTDVKIKEKNLDNWKSSRVVLEKSFPDPREYNIFTVGVNKQLLSKKKARNTLKPIHR